MSPELHDLMALQGDVKVMLIQKGIPQPQAHDLAAEVLHIIATSPLANDTHRKAYVALTKE